MSRYLFALLLLVLGLTGAFWAMSVQTTMLILSGRLVDCRVIGDAILWAHS